MAVISGVDWPSGLGTTGAGFGGVAGCVAVCVVGADSGLPQAASVKTSVAKSASREERMQGSRIDLDETILGMCEFPAPQIFLFSRLHAFPLSRLRVFPLSRSHVFPLSRLRERVG